jgi:group I intron endonuclease
MIGIYKIINPKGKIYIGQSINIEYRFYGYKKYIKCKSQRKLYNSLIKYGESNHTFSIIEECDIKMLNERERYWQEYFDTVKNGLNLKLTGYDDKSGSLSDETKDKVKEGLNKYFQNLTDKEKCEIYGKSSLSKKGKPGNKKGHKVSDETKEKISKSLKGHKVSDETKEKIKLSMIGRDITWGNKISEKLKGKANLKNRGNGNKPIIQFDKDNIKIKEWNSISEASNETKIPFNSISNNLVGRCKSSGGFIWKYKM